MSPVQQYLAKTDTCQDALRLLSKHGAAGWPVVDETGSLISLVSMESLVKKSAGSKVDPATVPCIIAGESNQIILPASLSLDEAWGKQFKLAAIAGEDGRIIGVLSRSDLASALYHQAEFQVKELEAVLNSAHNGIVVINSEGIITSFNRAAETLTKLPRDKAMGRHVLDVLVPLGLMEILQTGMSEYSQRFKVGRRTYIMNRDPVIQDGRITGAVGVFQDISEIDFVSQELASVKDLNRELDSIIQSSSDGFFVTDAAGNILRVNKAFEEMCQSSEQELIGHRTAELVERGLDVQALVETVVDTSKDATVMVRRQDHNLLVTGSPVFDEEGQIVRVVVNLRDMTVLNQLRQELLDAKRLSEQYHLELAELRNQQATGGLIASSPEMEKVLELVMRVAKVDSTCLLLGESGVGKERVAKLLHHHSQRKDGPFIKVNCGAIPEQLLESELFGYEAGAFTGARREGKIGLFELAHNGTLLLDEIGDLPFNIQAKLLRVLQERELVPVGGTKPREVNVRILAATHKDLERMVQSHEFREDLFFRLNVVPIVIPPLRERRSDIIPLLNYFREKFSKKYNIVREFSPEVVDAFFEHDWPGNVRELENMVERLMVVTPTEVIGLAQLPAGFRRREETNEGISVRSLMPLKDAVMEVERQLINEALQKFGSTYKAAEALGVNQSTIVRRLARFRSHGKDVAHNGDRPRTNVKVKLD